MYMQHESNQNSLAEVIMLTNYYNHDLNIKVRKVTYELVQDIVLENVCNMKVIRKFYHNLLSL